MRRIWIAISLGLCACSGHPDEGTVIEPGPGVTGVPGGPAGLSASRAVPISGGTLLVAKDGVTAIAADPDRDRVWLVDLGSGGFTEVILQQGDEPGRSAEDASGRVHVALRRGGAVVSIDLASRSIVARQDVCAAPRGIAYDALTDQVHVACQTGELVSLGAGGGVVRTLELGRDLRDVIVDGGRLLVSRFRSAELLVVDALGQVTKSVTPFADSFSGRTPFFAWRTLPSPSGGVLMLHQRGTDGEVGVESGGYASSGFDPCGGGSIVDETITPINPDGDEPNNPPPTLPMVAGPADFSVSPTGADIAVVATGNSWSDGMLPKVLIVPANPNEPAPCAPGGDGVTGEPTAVAWDGQGRVVIQSREPAQIQVMGGPIIQLSDDSRADTGLALFHMNAQNSISCSSCHAEGGEDGRTWEFFGIGSRRTQSLAGGVMGRAPFHWDGELGDFPTLVHEVFVSRMAGPRPNAAQIGRFSSWLDSIDAPAQASVDANAAQRGLALFQDPVVACASCHSGPELTNNTSVDVGTGRAFQVPSLVGVGARAPFLHDGCAKTLHDRFGPCGGGDKHGVTSHLTPAQIDDLVAYLESL